MNAYMNVVVLMPLFFSGRFFEREMFCSGLAGFAAFCFLSSLVYIINDIRDIDSDRQHPTKCLRPLASGAVSIPAALIMAAILAAAILVIGNGIRFPLSGWLCMIIYLAVNIGYSFGFKNVPILELAMGVCGLLMSLVFS